MKFTGIWIPADVALHKDISDKAKLAYGLITSLDNEDGCYASNAYIGSVLGVEGRQVRNLIEELIQHGLVMRILDQSGRTLKTIEKAALEVALSDSKESDHGNALPGGRQKIAMGGGKKLPPNSIEDNKVDKVKKALDALPFSTPRFINAWANWIDYRRDLKKPLHWKTINATFKELSTWTEDEAVVAIETSIKKGWLSLFKPRASHRPLTPDDHAQPW